MNDKKSTTIRVQKFNWDSLVENGEESLDLGAVEGKILAVKVLDETFIDDDLNTIPRRLLLVFLAQ